MLGNHQTASDLREAISSKLHDNALSGLEIGTEAMWNNAKEKITEVADEVLGKSDPTVERRK